MIDSWQNDKEFKQAIGAFIIAFSELEFGLTYLCTMTDFDLRKSKSYVSKYLGWTFEKKKNLLSDYINEHLPELESIWTKIKLEIDELNKERRFIAHGIMTYFLPNETITTHIKLNGKIVTKQLTISDINKLTNRLHQLNTGHNGINGEFHTLFTKTRVDKWNEMVLDELKMTYTVNGKIISNWKGIN